MWPSENPSGRHTYVRAALVAKIFAQREIQFDVIAHQMTPQRSPARVHFADGACLEFVGHLDLARRGQDIDAPAAHPSVARAQQHRMQRGHEIDEPPQGNGAPRHPFRQLLDQIGSAAIATVYLDIGAIRHSTQRAPIQTALRTALFMGPRRPSATRRLAAWPPGWRPKCGWPAREAR